MDVGTATAVESEESHFGEGMQERVKTQLLFEVNSPVLVDPRIGKSN